MFVCTNERAADHPRGSCKARGSEEILKLLKEEALKAGLNNKDHPRGPVRIQKSGCLEFCEKGPVAVIYPDAIWFEGLKKEDCAQIIQEHFLKAKK